MGFKERVYELCKKIPRGKVTSYKIVAEKLGTKAYRAVGNVLNKNPYKNVPCHRVIKNSGEIGGFALGKKKKIEILRKEGVKVKNNKIEKKYFYRFS